ncbi:family 78 glycoside hydrolase catalytic domain [Microbacterium sp. NPDC055903]
MSITLSAPSIEHHREPLGIGESRPRLSWKTQAAPGWVQTGYEIEGVIGADGPERIRVDGADSVLVAWPFRALVSRERAVVRVRVIGTTGESEWSAPTVLEAGLLRPEDWRARPVGAGWDEGPASDDRRPPLVRRSFEVAERPASARLYVSAHGLYEVEINGTRVGAEAMAPGWTVYGERLRYATYDVTDLISQGENAIGSWLGDGWYRGRMGWNGGFYDLYGSDIGLIAQLELRGADGSIRTIATDDSWKAAIGPIVRSGNYDGEVYDAREEQAGWSSPGFDDADWTPVRVGERDPRTLEAPVGPPVRCTQEVPPVAVLTSPSGRRVLDFGQNLVGRLRIRISDADAGHTVTLSTAEVLQDGEIYTRPLRSAKSTDVYIAAGRAEEVWEPRFTVHGFQYVDVSGWPGDLDAAVADGAIVARVYHTDMERTGWFDSSNELVNQLHENIVWGMRGNFLDIPTDCPQRDERVGWTGDIQVFAPTASFLYDCSGMLDSWLRDVAIEQLPDGTIPWYVPVIPAHRMWTPIRPGAVWGDVAVLTPWTLYERFGDAEIVARQYDSARRWVDLMAELAGDDRLWNEGFQLGDWLDPDAPPQDPAEAKTDRYLVATAYFAWSARHLAKMAELLGKDEDAVRYARLAEEVRAAFVAAYATADGRMASDAQTAYALAIRFELLSDEQRSVAGRRLAELVAEADNRISTGFAGTPIINDALTATGQDEASFALLLEQECPSWLYQVRQGATTVWERWDSMLPDGTVNPGTMTSFNHYALGSVADWMHRVLVGLTPVEPGYRRVVVEPHVGGGFTRASASHESPYGRIDVAWHLEREELVLDVALPTGTTGVIRLPGAEGVEIGPGVHRASVRLDVPTQVPA